MQGPVSKGNRVHRLAPVVRAIARTLGRPKKPRSSEVSANGRVREGTDGFLSRSDGDGSLTSRPDGDVATSNRPARRQALRRNEKWKSLVERGQCKDGRRLP